MAAVTTHYCDFCGLAASFKDNGTAGWITVQQRSDRDDDPLFGRFGFGGLQGAGEVCSWDCLAKYAAAHVLVEG